jgi:uncharacterized UPF0146 family protein
MIEDLKSIKFKNNIYKYGGEWTKHLESCDHWIFYWFQQKIMEGFINKNKSETIIEIGVGSEFTANYCRSKGFDVTTLDIDEAKKPDILANVVEYDFKEKYDHLMAFEILEHIPFEESQKIIKKIPTFVKKFAFISLPRNERTLLNIEIKLPLLKKIKLEWKILARKIFTEAHHWELDYKGYKTKMIEKSFIDAGLKIRRKLKNRYIYFYALEVCNHDYI